MAVRAHLRRPAGGSDAVTALVSRARVRDFGPGEGEPAGAAARGHDDGGWLEVAVPGDVHRALIDAGRIPHPFYDRHEDDCAWMEEREWWYRFGFEAPEVGDGERLRLAFHGIDTYATVWLNGRELGRHANMFREAEFDVTELVAAGEPNTVSVRLDPPLRHAGPELPGQWGPNNHERVWMRKAQYGYGWDWGPRLPTIGLWRPVELRRERRAALTGVAVEVVDLAPDHSRALVAVRVEAEPFGSGSSITARVRLTPPGDAPLEAETELGGTVYLDVARPQLWWTHDLGTPALHDLRVALEDERGELDARVLAVGLRTIALDQSPDPAEPGTRFFRFVLNGVPLFARGANWIPADSFVGALEAERYTERLVQARDANMNMVRVWGGGVYEHDAFYEECDRLGLLVWQDFMFACAMYPDDDADLTAEVELEARAQVARLRTHPCLALWCGNNENQWIHDRTFPERLGAPVPGARWYDELLPCIVAELDPRTPYWPGSPFGGSDHNAREDGDVHNWEVWHGNHPRRFGEPSRREPTPESVSFLRYAEDGGRFISEFGTLSAPDRETLKRWIPADQLFHHSPALDHHTKDNPKNKIDMLLESVTGVAADLDEFVDFSMIAQAEAMKFAVEHYRRRKPHCSGTLIWQLDDCWPVLSWALIDYHGFEKAAYHFVRRAYAPVLASFRVAADGAVELWVTNDTGAAVRDTAHVRLRRFAGEPLREQTVDTRVPAHASRPVADWAPGELSGAPDCYLAVHAAAGTFPANRHFFAAVKDLDRPRPQLRHSIDAAPDGRLRVHLSTDVYAYFVQVFTPEERVRYDDNYVELEPGGERTITLDPGDAPLRAQDVGVRAR